MHTSQSTRKCSASTPSGAKAAGAKIAIEIKNEDYGGRDFSCYDLEGHLWSFGTYDPWQPSHD
jgi:uncharacterized glyoxalase superfamily protein PhnB